MFVDQSNSIWGTKCGCGNDVYVLQNKFHPWVKSDFVARLACSACGNLVDVDVDLAATYYNEKIYSHFSDVKGIVLDLGCGDGFLSQYLLTLPHVTKVIALDNDDGCREAITKISTFEVPVKFVVAEADALGEIFPPNSIDYIISRDVFMFIKDTEQFFADVTKLTRQGIRQLGWYKPSTKRMQNELLPSEIKAKLSERGWKTTVEYPNWYKSGYYIRADK